MSYTCAKFQGNKKNDLSTLVFLNQNSPNFTIISQIFNLKSEFFLIFQKKSAHFRKLRNLTYLELQLNQFSEKSENLFFSIIIHHSSFIPRTGTVGLGQGFFLIFFAGGKKLLMRRRLPCGLRRTFSTLEKSTLNSQHYNYNLQCIICTMKHETIFENSKSYRYNNLNI